MRRRQMKRRRQWDKVVLQSMFAIIALASGFASYTLLEAYPVYRIVALVIIVILWSNAASTTARRVTIDMMNTISLRAIKVQRKRSLPSLTEDTMVYLRAIKDIDREHAKK